MVARALNSLEMSGWGGAWFRSGSAVAELAMMASDRRSLVDEKRMLLMG